ncbi:AAA-domain-containing protein, partial [Exidia glandulosa HHB12029]
MPRQATIRYVSLRNSLVNLPLSLYAPLVEHRVRAQGVAVHLSGNVKGKNVSAHVGWTGLAAASSLALRGAGASETVEIDPQYAASLGFAEGVMVEIGLLHDLPVAKHVATEPCSADDWEIIELHANYIEESLLSQVRVASVGQEVDAWVLGRTRVRFRVVSTDPPGPCMLSTDTEVSIAPKSRTVPRPASKPSTTEPVASTSTPSFSKPGVPLRVIPASLVKGLSVPSTSATEATLLVAPHTLESLSLAPSALVRVKALRPPFTLSKATAPANATSEPVARVLKPQERDAAPATKDPKKSDQEAKEETPVVARLLSDASVPIGQAVCIGVGSALVADWDIREPTPATTTTAPSITSELFVVPSSVLVLLIDMLRRPARLSGVDALLDEGTNYILHSFAVSAPSVTGLLVLGRPGSGRTSVAREVARRVQGKTCAHIIYRDMSSLAEDRPSVIKDAWRDLLDRSRWSSPAVLVLDNLDVVVGAEVEHADSSRQRHLAELFLSLFKGSKGGVAVIVTAKGTANLHPLLATSHLFGVHLGLKSPGREARREILATLISTHLSTSSHLELDPTEPPNYISLAGTTEGYSVSDLEDLVKRSVGCAVERACELTPALSARDFDIAQRDFVPLALRDVQQSGKGDVRWGDIGGLKETRRVLRETLEWPTKYGPIFAGCPLRLRSGLLLYGYPGCGKTLLASAVARECGLNFISVKGPELLNKYIGASEKSVRELFERASAAKPCVLFFDEFDSIAPKRGHDSTGVTDRVVNQMLTQMDGAEGLDGVYVLAATSRPDLIDPALLRPGRLDKALLCNMPDGNERLEILRVVARKVSLSPDVDLSDYTTQTEGYSGADLQALVYNAHLDAVHETMLLPQSSDTGSGNGQDGRSVRVKQFGAGELGQKSAAEETALQRRMAAMMNPRRSGSGSPVKPMTNGEHAAPMPKIEVDDGHLLKALRGMKPSLPADERARLDWIYAKFSSDRSEGLPAPSGGGGVGQRASLM